MTNPLHDALLAPLSGRMSPLLHLADGDVRSAVTSS
jgi:hypothetical protein